MRIVKLDEASMKNILADMLKETQIIMMHTQKPCRRS